MRAYQNLEVTGSINVTGSITADFMTATNFYGTASQAETSSYLSGSGDLFGSLTGSMTGSLTGSVSGTLIGSVTGTLVGVATGSFTGSFYGEFSGSGANLYDISASSIIGLDLSRIGSGSVTASADSDTGFTVKSVESGSAFSGSVNISGSLVVSGALTVVGADGSSLQIDVPSDPTTGSMFTIVDSDNSPIFEVFADKTARISGSLTVTGGTTGSFTGSFFGEFSGSGANLYDISASSIIGLNLSRIATGSVTASVDVNDGFVVTTNGLFSASLYVSGTVTASQFSGSGADLYDISASAIIGLNLARVSTGSVSASAYIEDGTGSFHITDNTYITGSLTANTLYADSASITYLTTVYETSSYIYLTGSTKFGDEVDVDVHEFTGSVGITGSFNVEGSSIFNGGVTGSSFTGSFTGSFNGFFEGTASQAATASYATNAASMDGGIY